MNTKLHAVTDAIGRPIRFFMSAGQISDYTGAAALLRELPNADWMIADCGYDADWFREALKDKEINPCIPGRKARKTPVKYDKRRYKRRNRIEIDQAFRLSSDKIKLFCALPGRQALQVGRARADRFKIRDHCRVSSHQLHRKRRSRPIVFPLARGGDGMKWGGR